ncbi:MAG: OmpA family protein [Deltaproteobacteria bacterium]|nr:OmpA family protein [Deltaproteobacteria bacterium]
MRYAWIIFLGVWLTGGEGSPAAEAFISRIHFQKNSFEILESERTLLNQNIEWLNQNPRAVLILEGHCDEWGEESYNLQLGDFRAREVKAFLIEAGIDAERMIMVVSYGESRPLDPRATREAWAANRRVEFVLR